MLAVPDDADVDEIGASMKNGVLTVTIPRKEVPESAAGKRIEIKTS